MAATDDGIDNPVATGDDGAYVRPTVVINVQPENTDKRAVLPVPTTDWQSKPQGQFMPVSGLDFLNGVSSLLLQQTAELNEISSKIESENRYLVKVPQGETLYYASEVSSSTQRCLCESGRSFIMHLHDNTRQEALLLKRRLASASCCFPCRLQEMQVITPPGDYIGCIQQQWSWTMPFFLVRDASDDVLFVIKGPAAFIGKPVIEEFQILTGDSLHEVGKVLHGWDPDLRSLVLNLKIPDKAASPKHKALLLGAAFLLEYTYFEGYSISNPCFC